MTIKKRVGKFLTSGIPYGEDFLLQRRIVLINSVLMMLIPIFFFFTLYNSYHGNYIVAVLDGIGCIISIAALLLLHIKKNLKLAIEITIITMLIFFNLFAAANQGEGYGLIWTIFFPIFAILLKGRTTGLLYVGGFYTVLLLQAYIGIDHWQNGQWDFTSFVRFSIASLVVVYSAYFNETSLARAYQQLKELHNSERHSAKALEKLSITDPLTDLYNRRHFDNVFNSLLNRAKRQSDCFALFILDVDHFKSYNDTYGHQAGDEALNKIGTVLKQHMRRTNDIVFRLGGEEFAGIIISDDADKALKQIEEIRTAIEELNIPHINSKTADHLTASIGVTIPTELQTCDNDTLYKYADEALYHAKAQGRNRTVIWHPTTKVSDYG